MEVCNIPRKQKVADQFLPDDYRYRCMECGMEYDTPVGNFFKISYSPLYKANGKYAPLCKNCVSKHFDEYSRRYRSDKKACILLCHELDIPFYHTLFDSIVQNNNTITMGL